MSMELDEAQDRLSARPVPAGLAGIEERVLVRVREEAAFAAQAVQRLRIGAAAAVMALGLGIAAGGPLTVSASPYALSPFGPSSPLVPLTLLEGEG
jgi:hypothetical protein